MNKRLSSYCLVACLITSILLSTPTFAVNDHGQTAIDLLANSFYLNGIDTHYDIVVSGIKNKTYKDDPTQSTIRIDVPIRVGAGKVNKTFSFDKSCLFPLYQRGVHFNKFIKGVLNGEDLKMIDYIEQQKMAEDCNTLGTYLADEKGDIYLGYVTPYQTSEYTISSGGEFGSPLRTVDTMIKSRSFQKLLMRTGLNLKETKIHLIRDPLILSQETAYLLTDGEREYICFSNSFTYSADASPSDNNSVLFNIRSDKLYTPLEYVLFSEYVSALNFG